ncbi:hypothetical protein R1sor_006509 [Riccia sorocarpa]|uniref:Reverse transcriptase domain-containing protein n=1 Tax=Riccia sorocarpa TaxID=122646 RepID=A0ABD3HN79_9MARC
MHSTNEESGGEAASKGGQTRASQLGTEGYQAMGKKGGHMHSTNEESGGEAASKKGVEIDESKMCVDMSGSRFIEGLLVLAEKVNIRYVLINVSENQANPANVHTQLKLETAQNALNVWEGEKARWMQRHLDKKYEDFGERSSHLFFNSLKARRKQMEINVLQDEHGVQHSDQDKLLDLTAQYFSSILQEPPPQIEQTEAADRLLSQVQAQVTPSERDNLQSAFTAEELLEAAKLLSKSKCPGPDGVPLEFFLTFWDTICPLLFTATIEAFQQQAMPPFFNKGMITLLQNDGDVTLLKNKRPITLLNTVYKIWAKVLQRRLSPVLKRVITWEQNAFIPGRQLHSTVFLCNEAIFQAKVTEQDSVFLKIDFKKAFDTLRWDFLYEAMQRMQFGEIFISYVKTLNNSASSCVRVNSTCSRSFAILRLVRQGCPLSPLLFTVAIQVLTYVINRMLAENQLKGIELQDIGIQYCQGYFADDSHLLLTAERQNLTNAKNLIHSFGLASGLNVQWEKSNARWISSRARPDWLQKLGWEWGTQDRSEKLLGFTSQMGWTRTAYTKRR